MQVTASLVSVLFGASGTSSANTGDPASGLAALKAAPAPGAIAKGVAQEKKTRLPLPR